jgi:hypothetical protein
MAAGEGIPSPAASVSGTARGAVSGSAAGWA